MCQFGDSFLAGIIELICLITVDKNGSGCNIPRQLVWKSRYLGPRYEQLLRKLKLPEEAIARHLATAERTP